MKRFDTKCYDLATAFLADETGISKEDLIKHSTTLAGEIQQLIEDYIEYDYRGKPLNPPGTPAWLNHVK